MKIIPPNRIVSSRLGGSEDYAEKGGCQKIRHFKQSRHIEQP